MSGMLRSRLPVASKMALAAGVDPVQFRLNHLDDPRATAVVQAVADRIGWQPHTQPTSRTPRI